MPAEVSAPTEAPIETTPAQTTPPEASVPEPVVNLAPSAEAASPLTTPLPAEAAKGKNPSTEEAPTHGEQWYIRPAAGGQFGPVDYQVLQQWVGEGRIDGEAHLWQTGWPDWQRANELTDLLPQLAPQLAIPPAAVPPTVAPPAPAQASDEAAPAVAASARLSAAQATGSTNPTGGRPGAYLSHPRPGRRLAVGRL